MRPRCAARRGFCSHLWYATGVEKLDTARLLRFDRTHIWHPYASMVDPLPAYPVDRARGVRLTLHDGTELIDGMSSWWTAIHGYRHPTLDRALAGQAERMAHVMFGGLTHGPAVELARRLLELVPAELDKVFFCDSGSVAVEVAIQMALQDVRATGRAGKQKLITSRRGYHGDTFAAMSVCDPVNGMHHLFGGLVFQQHFAETPSCGFTDPWRDEYADDLRRVFAEHAHDSAAAIVEPIVQGAGGMRFYHPRYLTELRALCDQHDVLLIFDEIATGFGRTGELFAAHHAGVVPDILCVGKALTGGYLSLAATLSTARVASGICQNGGVFMHGPTFMANPLACAVAEASLGLLSNGQWRGQVRDIEKVLGEELLPCAAFAGVADVRVLGAIGVIEFCDPLDMGRVQQFLVDRGVWLRPFGKLLYTMPPYIVDEADLRQITAAMRGIAEHGAG